MTEKVSKTGDPRLDNLSRAGRPKGVPNKATSKAREAFATFVEGNVDRMQEWLEDIAADPKHGPKVAFDCLLAVSEYHIPKLARTEHAGDPDAPLTLTVFKFQDD